MWEGVITGEPLRTSLRPHPQLCTRPRSISHKYQARQTTDDEAACKFYRAKISCSMGLGTPSINWRGHKTSTRDRVHRRMFDEETSTIDCWSPECFRLYTEAFHSVPFDISQSFSPFPSPNTIRQATIVVSPGEGHKKR